MEAYYNYMGHFTVVSSRTVDKMILKMMELEGCAFGGIVELLHNHNYLGYFPHYGVTNQLLDRCQANQEVFSQLVRVLINNPLIKLDGEGVGRLLEILEGEGTNRAIAGLVVRLLVWRMWYGLIDQYLTSEQLLEKLAEYYARLAIEGEVRAQKRSKCMGEWL